MSATVTIIADNYNFGPVIDFELLKGGLINITYRVRTMRGVFIFQRLNAMYDQRVNEVYGVISKHLLDNDFFVPRLLTSPSGETCHYDGTGWWRVFEHVANEPVDYSAITPEIAYNAGKTFGTLQTHLKGLDYIPTFKIKNFHDTPKIIEKLELVYSSDANKAEAVSPEYEKIISEISQYYLPRTLEVQLIHGDPKISNLLFKQGTPVAVVDFDGVIIGSPYLEIGDALRDWSWKEGNVFDAAVYEASLDGFTAGGVELDRDLAKQATLLITLELAARFLTDYFEESYFQWDNIKYSSSAEHNLQRARDCLAYYDEMKKVLSVSL